MTTKTVYVGNRQKLAELVTLSASSALPSESMVQEVGGSLALTEIAKELGVAAIIDRVCSPGRSDDAPIGVRLVLAAIPSAAARRRSTSRRWRDPVV